MKTPRFDLDVSSSWVGRTRRRVIGLNPAQTTFDVRGFLSHDPVARARLERVGRGFAAGFNVGLQSAHVDAVVDAVECLPIDLHGFGFEGAGMSLALLDRIWPPWNGRRVEQLLRRTPEHVYRVNIGVGRALAKLGRNLPHPPDDLDPLFGWLALDGYGFREGYVDWERWLGAAPRRSRPPLSGAAADVFDQGLGRSLWFSQGADVSAVAQRISTFERHRAENLWSGIGLASTYAGGTEAEALRRLRERAGPYAVHLGQGACLAAKARAKAGPVPPHTGMAVEMLCELSVHDAARLCDEALPRRREHCSGDDYQRWRSTVRAGLLSTMRP
ncbi:MAG: DUF1702 family protein [Deltaproteobacteria bacterium]|nr:DUF1702 family protein [Deltaproteobacteria bacterium]